MSINMPSKSNPISNYVSAPEKPTEKFDKSHEVVNSKGTFIESVAKDLNSGRMTPDVNDMVEAVLSPGKASLPKVQVKTFSVNGIQANDIMFIQRVPPVLDGTNIVLYIPEKEGGSFHSFNSLEKMNTWLKELAHYPQRLKAFGKHFGESGYPGRTTQVVDTMTKFKNNDIDAVVGPYAAEGSDIFSRLDRGTSEPPVSVNGLSHLKKELESPEGRMLYSGLRPDGEKVYFQYDAYGNFQGDGNKGNFYFLKNGLNSGRPLVPMSENEFKKVVVNEAFDNVGANDIRGFYNELLRHLENPSSGLGEALQVFGVNKYTADTVERYFDNPFSALLLDLNKNNQIGKVFGLEKARMDSILNSVGDIAQGFVPYYGQARILGSLLAKALGNVPMTVQEKKDLADGLAFKPDSPARKNLPATEPLGERTRLSNTPHETKTKGPIEEKPVGSFGVKDAPPVEEMPVQNGELIKLGGTMDSLTEVGKDIYTFVDLNKKDRQVRLNILAHGEEPNSWTLNTDTQTPARILYDGKPHTPQELLDTLKGKGIDPSDYDNVRLLMCYSGNGQNNSFAAEFSRLIGKPVKGYEGSLSAYITPGNVSELKGLVAKDVANTLGGENQLLPVEQRAVSDVSMSYVKGQFASKAFIIAKKNPHLNPIKAWTFTYRPVTFSPTP